MFHGYGFFEEISFDYTGGFKTLPADLEVALWMVFNTYWGQFGGHVAVGSGAIKSISSDGSRVEFDVSGGSSGVDMDTGMPSFAISVLDLYRCPPC